MIDLSAKSLAELLAMYRALYPQAAPNYVFTKQSKAIKQVQLAARNALDHPDGLPEATLQLARAVLGEQPERVVMNAIGGAPQDAIFDKAVNPTPAGRVDRSPISPQKALSDFDAQVNRGIDAGIDSPQFDALTPGEKRRKAGRPKLRIMYRGRVYKTIVSALKAAGLSSDLYGAALVEEVKSELRNKGHYTLELGEGAEREQHYLELVPEIDTPDSIEPMTAHSL